MDGHVVASRFNYQAILQGITGKLPFLYANDHEIWDGP